MSIGKIDIAFTIIFWFIILAFLGLIWEGQQNAYDAGWNHEEIPSVDAQGW